MEPQLAQIALCSTDLPRSVQLYTEAFGFAEAGGKVLWGQRVAQIQGLGDDAAFTLWWLVGRQDLVQLEFFHHTTPPQRAVADRAAERPRMVALRDHGARLRARARAARRPRCDAAFGAAPARRPAQGRLPRPVHGNDRGGAGGRIGDAGRYPAPLLRPRPGSRLRDGQRPRPGRGAPLLPRHAGARRGAGDRAARAGARGALGPRGRTPRELRRPRRRRLPRGRPVPRARGPAAARRPPAQRPRVHERRARVSRAGRPRRDVRSASRQAAIATTSGCRSSPAAPTSTTPRATRSSC